MLSFNLLPGQETEYQYLKARLKKSLMIVMIVAALVNVILHLILENRENKIQERINRVNEEIKNISHVKIPLSPKNLWKEIFSEKSVMRDTCFNKIIESEKNILFAGKARSVSDLTSFLKQWQVVGIFSEIKIKLIEDDGKGMVKFELEGKI